MIDQEQVLEILHAIGEKITEEKLYLTELDNVIGDGDHGINLARGFAEVEKKRPMMEGKDIGTMLKTAGMALVSTVGGASGPLYGTAFMGRKYFERDIRVFRLVRETVLRCHRRISADC